MCRGGIAPPEKLGRPVPYGGKGHPCFCVIPRRAQPDVGISLQKPVFEIAPQGHFRAPRAWSIVAARNGNLRLQE